MGDYYFFKYEHETPCTKCKTKKDKASEIARTSAEERVPLIEQICKKCKRETIIWCGAIRRTVEDVNDECIKNSRCKPCGVTTTGDMYSSGGYQKSMSTHDIKKYWCDHTKSSDHKEKLKEIKCGEIRFFARLTAIKSWANKQEDDYPRILFCFKTADLPKYLILALPDGWTAVSEKGKLLYRNNNNKGTIVKGKAFWKGTKWQTQNRVADRWIYITESTNRFYVVEKHGKRLENYGEGAWKKLHTVMSKVNGERPNSIEIPRSDTTMGRRLAEIPKSAHGSHALRILRRRRLSPIPQPGDSPGIRVLRRRRLKSENRPIHRLLREIREANGLPAEPPELPELKWFL